MVLLDINQDKNVLDQIVITKFDNLIPLLDKIIKNEGINQNRLRKESGVSGGKIYHSVKAMKSMGLVRNGMGLKVTDLGRDFFNSYKHNQSEFKNILRVACLNVPIFNEIHEENEPVRDEKTLFKIFQDKLEEKKFKDIDDKLIGSGVRRYLFGVHNIQLRAGARLYPKEKIKNSKREKKSDDKIIDAINNFKNVLDLSTEEIYHIIHSLPEKKRDEIMPNIFSKVFS